MQEYDEGKGWVIKAPYTTNCEYIKYTSTFDDVHRVLRDATERFNGLLP